LAGKKINNYYVYISESLTAVRKKLFGKVNKLKKTIKFIWTNNGKIYLKQSQSTSVNVFDNEDVDKFQSNLNLDDTQCFSSERSTYRRQSRS
jgi:hypothetical protein